MVRRREERGREGGEGGKKKGGEREGDEEEGEEELGGVRTTFILPCDDNQYQ